MPPALLTTFFGVMSSWLASGSGRRLLKTEKLEKTDLDMSDIS